MKKLFAVAVLMLASTLAVCAQSTRPLTIAWNASTTSGVLGYNLYRCQVPTGSTTCTPSITTAPLNGSTLVTVLLFNDNGTIGNTYVYGITAVASPCSPTSLLTVSCGSSALAISSLVPVPIQPGSVTTITIVMP